MVAARFGIRQRASTTGSGGRRLHEEILMATNAVESFDAGMRVLGPLMEAHGFKRTAPLSGESSGGTYASAQWVRGDRVLDLHFRHSLGLVSYRVGDVSLSHEEYMWAVTGRKWSTEYPGFSDDPLDGFRHLRADLEKHGSSFLTGSDANFLFDVGRATLLKQTAPRLP